MSDETTPEDPSAAEWLQPGRLPPGISVLYPAGRVVLQPSSHPWIVTAIEGDRWMVERDPAPTVRSALLAELELLVEARCDGSEDERLADAVAIVRAALTRPPGPYVIPTTYQRADRDDRTRANAAERARAERAEAQFAALREAAVDVLAWLDEHVPTGCDARADLRESRK